jgi:adenine-specific DNA-methyltransferase
MKTPILPPNATPAYKLEALRQLFPEAVQSDPDGRIRVNPAGIQMALDPGNTAGVRVEEDGYELRWVGKREAYHQAFVPTSKILSAAHDQSKNWDGTGNLLIKGDNLDALKLLRHSYFGKVKLIYIDPPYNTQSDAFVYRDDFSASQSEVLTQLGYSADSIDYIKNIYGARTHSGWLSFMYPRLLLARDMLRDDGVIFISIDDNEQAQLKLMCDEVFGQDNFVCSLIWNKQHSQQQGIFKKYHESVLLYSKDQTGLTNISGGDGLIDAGALKRVSAANPASDFEFPAGVRIEAPDDSIFEGTYGDSEKVTVTKGRLISRGGITVQKVTLSAGWTQRVQMEKYFRGEEVHDSKGQKVAEFYFNSSGKLKCLKERTKITPPSLLPPYGMVSEQSSYLASMLGANVFDSPKPIAMMRDFVSWFAHDGDIVLDFFAGSGTTAEAVMRLNAEDGGNRQFILVQIPQPIDAAKQKEAHDFLTHTLGRPEATIFEITAERIRRAGAKIEAERLATQQAQGSLLESDVPPLDTGFRVFELVDDPLGLVHRQPLHAATQADVAAMQTQIATPQPADMQRVLSNLLLSEGLPWCTRIHTLVADHLFMAADVALLLQALPLPALTAHLKDQQAAGTSLRYLTVYAPWVHDNNLLLALENLMDALGLGKDKLRLRG